MLLGGRIILYAGRTERNMFDDRARRFRSAARLMGARRTFLVSLAIALAIRRAPHIAVASEPGRGTCVEIFLPASRS